ncbi:MAG: GH25 family lysozyme [Acidovorax sp.]
MATWKGIDVSEHNGIIDWDKVKADGIHFAMIRMGIGSDIKS